MRIDKNNYEAFFLDYFEGALSAERVAELMLFLEQHPELKKEFDEYENISLNDIEEGIKFENKDQLKKETISSTNFEEMAVAYIERKLTAEEETALFAFIAANPNYKVQLELFRKTILSEEKIVFENKSFLKKQAELSETESLLLSSLEGTINTSEQKQLDAILAGDTDLKKELTALKNTKLAVDRSVIFPDKNSLKRRETKVVPFYYYVSAAASIALLIGLYFLSGNEPLKGDQLTFNKKDSKFKQHIAPQETLQTPNNIATYKEKKFKKNNSIILPNDKPNNNNNKNKIQENLNQDEAIIVKNESKKQDSVINEEVIVKNDHPINEKKENILVNSFNDQDDSPLKKDGGEYLSLGQTFAYKVKNKMLKEEMSDNSTYKEDKKKITWYDAVLVAMKGLRSLTGREVDVRKKYNEKNELIAYQYTVGNRTFTKAVTKKAS